MLGLMSGGLQGLSTRLTHIQASIASVRSVVLEEGLTTRVVHSSFSTRCKKVSMSTK